MLIIANIDSKTIDESLITGTYVIYSLIISSLICGTSQLLSATLQPCLARFGICLKHVAKIFSGDKYFMFVRMYTYSTSDTYCSARQNNCCFVGATSQIASDTAGGILMGIIYDIKNNLKT